MKFIGRNILVLKILLIGNDDFYIKGANLDNYIETQFITFSNYQFEN